jgi:hypothetical protein
MGFRRPARRRGNIIHKAHHRHVGEMMSRSRRILVLALCGSVAPLLAVATAAPAQAWTWNQSATVYDAGNLCVQGDAGIDHVRPGVFSGNLAYADTYARTAGCGAGLAGMAAAVRLDVYKLTGSTWSICRSTDWTYGTTGMDQWGATGPEQVFDYGGVSSCGPGQYGTMAWSYVSDGATWRGGSVWSGAESVS